MTFNLFNMKNYFKTGLFALLFFPLLAQGQEIGLIRLDPDRPDSQGEAALWGGVEQGRFRSVDMPLFQWSAGARAAGVRHGKNTSWKGSLSIEQKTGMEMASSMFLEPGYFPVDLLEFTPGTKSRETGRLEAGFLTDLGYEWAAGIKGSVQAAYSGKRTDLRHSAFGLSIRLEPTVTYVMDDNMGLASSYVFRLRTEQVHAKKTGEDTPSLFLDKGMRYGEFVDAAGAFPVMELSHGFSELFYSEEFTAGLEWLWKRGQAGAAGFGKFKFPGSTVSVFVEQSFLADNTDHRYRISYGRERDQLRAIDADGSTALSDRLSRRFGLRYEARFLHGAVKGVGIDLDGRRWVERSALSGGDQTKRNLGSATLFSSFSFGPVDLKVEALAGGGLWRDRGRSRSEVEDTDYRQTDNWLKQMDYQMVPRIGAGGVLTWRIAAVKGLFLQLDGQWNRALRLTKMGGYNREIGNLTVGYKF